ncbi:FHA domain-containing protein [Burkholderiaceae bacterium DAT-1]|nr:FHA domain-containing protein [Burkholderiaceae bacterium DAT-1]
MSAYFCLNLMVGKVIAHRFPLVSGSNLIGRSSDCHINLVDGTVSSIHAEILVQENPESAEFVDITIHDCKSTNGVWVNERQIMDARLRVGDQIRCGEAMLVLAYPEHATADLTNVSMA